MKLKVYRYCFLFGLNFESAFAFVFVYNSVFFFLSCVHFNYLYSFDFTGMRQQSRDHERLANVFRSLNFSLIHVHSFTVPKSNNIYGCAI